MKKWLVFVLLFVLLTSFIYAQNGEPEMPESPVGDEDMQKIQEAVDAIPLDESGKFDASKLEGRKSAAEARIEAINLVIAENASWLRFVFGMIPEISLFFAVNLYVWLYGLVIFVLNAKNFFILKAGNWTFFSIENGGHTYTILGICAFAILFIGLKINLLFAGWYWVSWEWANDKWYGMVVRLISLIGASVIIYRMLKIWGERRKKKAEEAAKAKEDLNRKILEKTVKPLTTS